MPGRNALRALPRQVRFLAGESTGSYVTRLAARNGLGVQQLLDSVGQGQSRAVDPRYTELYVDAAGRERLAALTGRPVAELRRTLIGLRDEQLLPDGGDGPVWKWPWEPRDGYLVRACALCTAARGIEGPVWLMRSDNWHICVRHGRLTDNSRDDSRPFARLDRWPGTVAAEQRRLQLQQRLGPVGRALVADAFAVLAGDEHLSKLGSRRGVVIHLLPSAMTVALVMARVEHPRLTGRLTPGEYGRWMKDALAELPSRFGFALQTWMKEHRLLPGRRGSGERPSGVRSRPAAPHADIPELASVDQLSCLPWDMLGEAERPFG